MTFDFPALSNRDGDSFDRFVWFLEQLQEAIRLLKTGRIPLQRMALVALDTLAEGLLFRHIDALFFINDEFDYFDKSRFYPARERRQSRERFSKRVALAQEVVPGWMYPEPILDGVDAAIFRVAHHYRNPVYHEDRHNPTLIETIGRVYGQSVGRAFVRSQRKGLGHSISAMQLSIIEQMGWRPDGDGFLWPRDAAEEIVGFMCRTLDVDVSKLRAGLAEDITYRCEAISESLDSLGRDGIEEEQLQEMVAGAQDWAANRGDEVLLGLQEKKRDVLAGITSKQEADEQMQEELRRLDLQIWNHLFDPERRKAAGVDLLSHFKIAEKGRKLGRGKSSYEGLLLRYQGLDQELEILEDTLDYVTMQWDRHVQQELDRLRGK